MTSGREKVANKTTKKRDFSDFSSVRFNNGLSIVDWVNIIVSKANSLDDRFSSFHKQSNKVVQKHAPLKVVSKRKIKQLAKPWITKGIRTSIKITNRLYKTGNCGGYKSYRNKIITLTRLSKKQYYLDFSMKTKRI